MKPQQPLIAAIVVACLASVVAMVLAFKHAGDDSIPPLQEQQQLKSWMLPSGVVIEQFVPGDSFYCLVASQRHWIGPRAGGVAMVCAGVKPPSSAVEESP